MAKTNHVRLIGHLGQNPKLVNVDSQNMILSVSMATNMKFRDKDGNQAQKTEWHNLVAFGKVAQLLNSYTKQGTHLMVEGHLQTRNYTNKKGEERYTTEIVVEEVLFLDSKEKE